MVKPESTSKTGCGPSCRVVKTCNRGWYRPGREEETVGDRPCWDSFNVSKGSLGVEETEGNTSNVLFIYTLRTVKHL